MEGLFIFIWTGLRKIIKEQCSTLHLKIESSVNTHSDKEGNNSFPERAKVGIVVGENHSSGTSHHKRPGANAFHIPCAFCWNVSLVKSTGSKRTKEMLIHPKWPESQGGQKWIIDMEGKTDSIQHSCKWGLQKHIILEVS